MLIRNGSHKMPHDNRERDVMICAVPNSLTWSDGGGAGIK